MKEGARSAYSRAGHFTALLFLVAGLSGPLPAVDGVIEINAASGTNFITQPGSYRLTSDITVGAGSDGIRILADNVTLDLNGFTVHGSGGSLADGISPAAQKNVEVKNGTVRGFSRHGVFAVGASQNIRVINVRALGNSASGIELQGVGSLVDGCTATANGTGIRVIGDGSLVINSVVRGNTTFGLVLSNTTGYRSNVLTGNPSGDVTAAGLQLGPNVCGNDLVCP
jgi:hypothetical protein